ncbi:MAG TPA: hypothetical protein VLM40_15700, partial [Gemmata sp.]|nr:hypothetical protein [Gemmata sp.]
IVQVTGRILQRGGRVVVLETGTSQRYQISAAFTSNRFAALKDEEVLSLRGTCAGIRGTSIRIENSERVDSGVLDGTVPRTTGDFLPYQSTQALTYDVLEPAKPGRPITRYISRFAAPDMMHLTAVRHGMFPAGSLFGGDSSLEPKWTWEPKTKSKLKARDFLPRISWQYRMEKSTIQARPVPDPPAQPSPWWEPVLKLGLKQGETWSSEMPDGTQVAYRVVSFGKDEAGRDTLHIHRSETHPKNPNMWQERTVTYVRGVGEVKRIVTQHWAKGAVAIVEVRLVETEATLKTAEPNVPIAPMPMEKRKTE